MLVNISQMNDSERTVHIFLYTNHHGSEHTNALKYCSFQRGKYFPTIKCQVYIQCGTKVGLQMWVCKTQFILVLAFINYYIIILFCIWTTVNLLLSHPEVTRSNIFTLKYLLFPLDNALISFKMWTLKKWNYLLDCKH